MVSTVFRHIRTHSLSFGKGKNRREKTMKSSLTPRIAYENAINAHVAALCVHRHNVSHYTLTVAILTSRQCDVLKHKNLHANNCQMIGEL
jgi:hypothetical protein